MFQFLHYVFLPGSVLAEFLEGYFSDNKIPGRDLTGRAVLLETIF